jgi:thymidylate synthase (FAD)
MSDVILVAMTKPEQYYTGCEEASDFVAYCARVSNPANQSNKETTPKLLKYMVDHQHWSPFEMVHLVMQITTTRDISRQILRHRSFSFQEFSQRYAKQNEFAIRESRIQDKTNRQNSTELDLTDPANRELNDIWQDHQRHVMIYAKKAYEFALSNGIAHEQARVVLPEGMTKTKLYMSGTLRSWIHYCQLRTANGTQKEHMEIAKACWNIITEHFPDIAKALHND